MINVKDAPIDHEEIRLWANGYREQNGLSWKRFATECDLPPGTLQPWCRGTYQAPGDNIARSLFMFRQQVDSREERQQALPVDPGYFETLTSQRIRTLLQIAHAGRITVVATGPGTGKTMTIRDYAQRASPVWIATMKPSTARLPAMVLEVLRALGAEPKFQWMSTGSRMITERLRDRQGLLIIDEANHLMTEALEEIRSWHDDTGVGICLLGNEELEHRFSSGKQRDRFARLNRRIARRLVQRRPEIEDARAFCDAWGLIDPGIRKFIEKIATYPDAGGLGECAQLVEAGTLLAASEDRGLSLADLRDAKADRATRWIDA